MVPPAASLLVTSIRVSDSEKTVDLRSDSFLASEVLDAWYVLGSALSPASCPVDQFSYGPGRLGVASGRGPGESSLPAI